jgi:hypothetical protein
MHSKLATPIGSGGDHSTMRTTNDHGFADQLRVVHLFNLGTKGIHVYVQNTWGHQCVQIDLNNHWTCPITLTDHIAFLAVLLDQPPSD